MKIKLILKKILKIAAALLAGGVIIIAAYGKGRVDTEDLYSGRRSELKAAETEF